MCHPTGTSHPGAAPLFCADLQEAMRANLDGMVALLDEEACGNDGLWYTAFQRLRFAVGDDCGQASIYLGVCSGYKSQLPLSRILGQYNTQEHPRFAWEEQVALMRRLAVLVNRHAALAEEEVCLRLPVQYAKQARLRQLLNRHPAFQQAHSLAPWFAAKGRTQDYFKCGLESVLFTNVYISLGTRSRQLHTVYRNPSVTHLTTRQLGGGWGGHAVTGQTVLFDRHAAEAVVLADCPEGRQLIGGLSAVLHSCLGPDGDVSTGTRLTPGQPKKGM